jgi:sirohydrochlorin cobaltochelatase
MKKKLVMSLCVVVMSASLIACSGEKADEAAAAPEATEEVTQEPENTQEADDGDIEDTEDTADEADDDQAAADKAAALIDAIYVQERTDETDAQCEAAKAAWDALTDAQKELVEGENADPDYFGRDTGDASKDDPLNQDEIGENELLVVSFGTSFNDSRAEDIGGIEKALQKANPDWSVRRAFTAQIIINHVQARDGEKIDNMDQALERAVANGVKNLVVQPTHLMHGAEYDELVEAVDNYKDKFDSVKVAEPLLGEVGKDASEINADKETVAKALTAEALAAAGYDTTEAAAADGTAFVFMGHGTSHTASVTYDQMQTQMKELGYANVFIGTVEGEPEDTACEAVIESVKEAGYKKVILRPLMVVAGDHANNDMAGDDADSWKSQFTAAGVFDSVDAQIEGLGRIADVESVYAAHTAAVIE